jgi:hypothetical protein
MGADRGTARGLRAEPTRTTVDTRFNVIQFGAKGNGNTDDTAAIQAAIDAAGKVQGCVYFPNGVYNCANLRIPRQVVLEASPPGPIGISAARSFAFATTRLVA